MRIHLRWPAAMLLVLAAATTTPATAQEWVYSARPGDNLWNLSERYLRSVGMFRRLQAHNGISDPLHILPGTRIRFPVAWLRVQPAAVHVLEVRGGAVVERAADGSTATLDGGESLQAGDRLSTADDGRVVLEFADGSRMLVRGDSFLEFDHLSAYGDTGMVDTRVRMRGGRIESDVTPAAGPGSRFEIETPAAVAAVRGTRFRIGADEVATRSEVIEGRVRVSGSGRGRDVGAGFGVVAESGRAPPAPRELLAAPEMGELPEVLTELVLRLEFEPIEGAVAYRAELYGAQGIGAVDDAVVTSPLAEFDAPPDGHYRLSVRGIETDGLEGRDATHAFEVNARPVPPAMVQPPDRAATHGQPPELWWSTPADAVSYHLQLAADPDFQTLLLDEPALQATRLQPALELEPGTYFWRLAQRDGSGEMGPFGQPRSFRMQEVPEPPAPGEAAVEEDSLTIGWGAVANASRYEFQMARDEGFADVAIAEELREPSLTLERPDAGTWWFRSRGVSDEGVPGPWSPSSSIDVPVDKPWALLLLVAPLLLLL